MSKNKYSDPIKLTTPIKRGDTEVAELKLRKPDTGSLRGCSLNALLNSDVDEILMVLPRISDPILTADELATLDPVDLVSCAGVLVGFLVPSGS